MQLQINKRVVHDGGMGKQTLRGRGNRILAAFDRVTTEEVRDIGTFDWRTCNRKGGDAERPRKTRRGYLNFFTVSWYRVMGTRMRKTTVKLYELVDTVNMTQNYNASMLREVKHIQDNGGWSEGGRTIGIHETWFNFNETIFSVNKLIVCTV